VKELNIYSDESGQTNKAPFVSASIVTMGEISFLAKTTNKRNFPEVKEKLKGIDARYSKYVSIVKDKNFFEQVQRKCEKMNPDFKKDIPPPNYVWVHCRSQIIAHCLHRVLSEDCGKVNVVLHEKSLKKGAKDRFESMVKIALDVIINIINHTPRGYYIRDGYLWKPKWNYTKRLEEFRDKIFFIWTQDERHGGVALAHALAGYYKIGLKDHSYITALAEVGVESLDLSRDVSNWSIPV
jgi:hypothetical protein